MKLMITINSRERFSPTLSAIPLFSKEYSRKIANEFC